MLPILSILSLQGCHPTRNHETLLSGGYILSASSANDISIRPRRVFSLSEPHIPAKVVALGWNERFIIAKQHPLRSIGAPVVANGGRIQQVGIYYSITNYWILDTGVPEIHGPFSNSEYLRQREALGVPVQVEMSSVSW